MATDRRIKGCPNEECSFHRNKIKQKAEVDYCPKCGSQLIYVCAKCFSQIEDIDSKHRICSLCEAKAEEKKAKRIEKAKNIGGKVGKAAIGVVGTVAVGIVGKVVKDGENEAIKKGSAAVKDVAKMIIKK